MTRLLDRLRSWVGSLFGGEDDAESDAGASEPRIQGSAPAVAHRDDRPLETPDGPPADAGRTRPEATDDDRTRPEATDDADGVDAPDPADDSGPVSVPDAEAVAGGDEETESPSPGVEADGPTVVDPEDADGFACSVCGTSVDGPGVSCPLCRSTDVVPVAHDDESDDDAETRAGDESDDAETRAGDDE